MTTDPARDTSRVLRTLPRPLRPGVRRASPADLRPIDRLGKPLGVVIEKGQKLPSGGYEVSHSTTVIAIDGRRHGAHRLECHRVPVRARLRHPRAAEEEGLTRVRRLAAPDGPVHPQPRPGRLAPRAGADPRPTRCASSSASSPRSGSASGAGWPAAASGARSRDLAVWAVPFGLVGGRLYHVVTDHDLYFGDGQAPDRGAVRLARRPRHLGRDRGRRARRVDRRPPARASGCCRCSTRWRPDVLVAQAIGRWGN